jgi:hypothetical protein
MMKKIILAVKIFILFFFISSFSLGIYSNESSGADGADWGQWKNVSCYKGIQFRLSRGEFYNGQYMWHVQFRNLYDKEVRFGWNIVDPDKEAVTRKERNILDVWRLAARFDPDEPGNNRDAAHGGNWTNSSGNVFVYVTNLQFSNNGSWDNRFADCDN